MHAAFSGELALDLPDGLRLVEPLRFEVAAGSEVEIEARIVVTSRNFTRDLGIQWGFSSENSALCRTPTSYSTYNPTNARSAATSRNSINSAYSSRL